MGDSSLCQVSGDEEINQETCSLFVSPQTGHLAGSVLTPPIVSVNIFLHFLHAKRDMDSHPICTIKTSWVILNFAKMSNFLDLSALILVIQEIDRMYVYYRYNEGDNSD